MADGQALSEGRHYDAFVTRSITELQRGLELDDTSAKAGVSSVVQAVLGGGDEVVDGIVEGVKQRDAHAAPLGVLTPVGRVADELLLLDELPGLRPSRRGLWRRGV